MCLVLWIPSSLEFPRQMTESCCQRGRRKRRRNIYSFPNKHSPPRRSPDSPPILITMSISKLLPDTCWGAFHMSVANVDEHMPTRGEHGRALLMDVESGTCHKRRQEPPNIKHTSTRTRHSQLIQQPKAYMKVRCSVFVSVSPAESRTSSLRSCKAGLSTVSHSRP